MCANSEADLSHFGSYRANMIYTKGDGGKVTNGERVQHETIISLG